MFAFGRALSAVPVNSCREVVFVRGIILQGTSYSSSRHFARLLSSESGKKTSIIPDTFMQVRRRLSRGNQCKKERHLHSAVLHERSYFAMKPDFSRFRSSAEYVLLQTALAISKFNAIIAHVRTDLVFDRREHV
jgi:hypothetical protein